ncbi:MATE family efflux transporter [Sorangium sp. So ce1000]|uniref:MATE family efflux transporter n=1 Tax=Sorangium sp. So ce1000 TaxID=3133325 RepID=UPI003F605384
MDTKIEAKAPSAPRGVHDMTQGKPRAHVVRVMLFILTGMMIQTLYGLVDIYWVGRLGKEAVAAVALSSNLMFVSLAATQMLSVGCVALVSQAAGRKEHGEVQRLFNQAQSLATWAGAVFLVLGLAFHRTYAERLSGDAVTAELAISFLRTFVPALALQFTMVGLGSALRGIGDMKPSLVAQTASVLLNMVLAPFLVFGWISGHPLGVQGASIATLIATAAAVAGLAVYLVRGKTFLRLRLADWQPDLSTWRKMLSIGLPSGAEFLLIAITMGVIYAVTRPFGAEAQAGVGIAARLMQACFMPAVAISFSAAAVVGQNYGSRAYARVRETAFESVKLVLGFMLFFTLLCQVFPAQLVGLFSPAPDVITAGVDYLQVVSWGFFASGIVFVSAGVFQGLGNTWPSLIASGLRALAFIVPALVLSARAGFSLRSLWLVSLGTTLGQFGLQQFLLRRELAIKAPASP